VVSAGGATTTGSVVATGGTVVSTATATVTGGSVDVTATVSTGSVVGACVVAAALLVVETSTVELADERSAVPSDASDRPNASHPIVADPSTASAMAAFGTQWSG